MGGLARVYDVNGIKVPERYTIIVRQLMEGGKLVQVNARTIHAAGTDPTPPWDDAA